MPAVTGSHRQQVIDQELQAPLALILVNVQAIDELRRALRQRHLLRLIDVVEGDGIEAASAHRHLHPHLKVALADDARRANDEHAIEARLREGLAPGAAAAQRVGRLKRNLRHGKFAVGLDAVHALALAEAAFHFLVEGARKALELGKLQGQTGRHRMTAEFDDEVRVARGDAVEHIADVHARDGASRAAQARIVGARKSKHRAAHALLDAARDEADDTLVPALIVETHAAPLQRAPALLVETLHGGERIGLHARLDRAALAIEPVEAAGKRHRLALLVRQQTLDADLHVIDATGGVQPRRDREGKVRRGEMRLIARRQFKKSTDAGNAAPRADALETLR